MVTYKLDLADVDWNEIKARVAKAAQILEIEDLLHRKPKDLSGGQRQRVAMGRAIVRQPKVFLFDEPLSNLDAKLRVQMRSEISKLHKRLQTTVVYVTHDQVEAMTLAERIVVMRNGEIMDQGTPLDVFNHPRNIFVAGFIGSPAMNFFSVAVTKEALAENTDPMDMVTKHMVPAMDEVGRRFDLAAGRDLSLRRISNGQYLKLKHDLPTT